MLLGTRLLCLSTEALDQPDMQGRSSSVLEYVYNFFTLLVEEDRKK